MTMLADLLQQQAENQGYPVAGYARDILAELRNSQYAEWRKDNRKVTAIKTLRECSGWSLGLKEAKEIIDEWFRKTPNGGFIYITSRERETLDAETQVMRHHHLPESCRAWLDDLAEEERYNKVQTIKKFRTKWDTSLLCAKTAVELWAAGDNVEADLLSDDSTEEDSKYPAWDY